MKKQFLKTPYIFFYDKLVKSLIFLIVAFVLACASSQELTITSETSYIDKPTSMEPQKISRPLRTKDYKQVIAKKKKPLKKKKYSKKYNKPTPEEINKWDSDLSGPASQLNGM